MFTPWYLISLFLLFCLFFPPISALQTHPPLRHWHQIMHTAGCFSGNGAAQYLSGVAVIHIPMCSVPLLKHGGRLCQPNKALVSNTKRHCGSSIVTCSTSYHIESDGVTLFCSEVQLQRPKGIMGVNLLHTASLQARESAIISRCRWWGGGLQRRSPHSALTHYWNLVWDNVNILEWQSSRQWMMKFSWNQTKVAAQTAWFIIYLWREDTGGLPKYRTCFCW